MILFHQKLLRYKPEKKTNMVKFRWSLCCRFPGVVLNIGDSVVGLETWSRSRDRLKTFLGFLCLGLGLGWGCLPISLGLGLRGFYYNTGWCVPWLYGSYRLYGTPEQKPYKFHVGRPLTLGVDTCSSVGWPLAHYSKGHFCIIITKCLDYASIVHFLGWHFFSKI